MTRPAPGGGSFLVALRLAGRRALVVGAGRVGAERARLLLDAGATVRVVATRLGPEVRALVLDAEERAFEERDLDGVDVVCAATDDPAVSRAIAEACRARRILVNVADVPALCDFYLPAVHRDGPVQIAVTTNGEAPALAARIRDRLAAALPAGTAEAVRRFGELRRRVRAREPDPATRMAWLGRVAERPIAELATMDVDATLAGARGRHPVLLVGAGPGDPELLTVAARRAIEEADLVLADRLVPAPILALATGEVRIAAKTPGNADRAQDELEAWCVEAALAGRRVVRLKIGDPSLFARTAEEVETLSAWGIPHRIVPGVSSVHALGFPLTARGVADRVVVTTAHGAGGREPEVPAWNDATSFVFLMGVGRLATLRDALLRAGFPRDAPVAVVSAASRPEERRVHTRLDAVVEDAAGLEAPAVVVVGGVAAARVAIAAAVGA